jgi:L-alanine-DL-glutamate epimerase-like enolase superfamily enzyme
MQIVNARETTISIGSNMRNAAIDFSGMTVSIAALVTDETRDGRPVIGYGFNSNGRYAQGGVLRERLVPRILAAHPDSLCDPNTGALDPARIWDAAMRNEKPGGHGERAVAMAVVDMAAWDLAAKLAELPLHILLAERFPHASRSTTAAVYAAGGYYTEGGIAALQAELLGYVEEGYRAVKMKIGGAPLDEDVCRIEAVRTVLPGEVKLAVDANARFDLETAVEYATRLEPYDLAWFEEPCAPLEYATFARLAAGYSPPLATGENLLSADDFGNLLRYGGLRPDRDVLQPDPGLAYGLTEFLRMLDILREHGWMPRRVSLHGGHQLSLALTAAFDLGPCESYPGLFAPIGGFADGFPIDDGIIALPEEVGIGLELKSGLLPVLRSLTAE